MTASAVISSGATAPLSVAQEALWYASRLAPRRISYNETISIRKAGPFDALAFRRAFNEIVRRHDAWHTTFDVIGGEPVQVIGPAPSFDLPAIDLSSLPPDQAERRAVRISADVSKVPYDVRRGPLLRPRLMRFSADEHRLYLALHHLVFDGVSVYRVVLPELVALYDAFRAGLASPLPELVTHYADYARTEQEWIIGPRAARRLEHWRARLTPLPVLSLPTDRPRPPVQRFRGGVVPVSVPAETVHRLRAVGHGRGATLFQVLATTWAVLLGRHSGQDDVSFATAADLRRRPELEAVVGYCLTPLVVRTDLSGDPSFADLVVRVRDELLDGLDNLVPFERVIRELALGAIGNANPVYQTMLVLEPPALAPDPSWSIHQMESEIGNAVGGAKLDLELELDERPEGHIAGRLIYDRDLFEAATAARIAEHWQRLVSAGRADPSQPISSMPILSPAERHRQIVEWNTTATERPGGGVHDLVAARCTRFPDAPAVSAGSQTVSYGELDRQATVIAQRLRAESVGPGDIVALSAEPSVELIADLLGVTRAGAAYLLLDPALPRDRLDFIAADCAGAAALTAAPSGVPPIDAVCCVQYTSPATGDPNGVPLSHASVINLAAAMATELGIGPADTVLSLPATFLRASVLELWMPLIAGAKILAAPAELASDGAELGRLIAREGVTFIHASPSAWQVLINTGLSPRRGLRGLSGGEPLTAELAEQILERCQVLWNAYGAPETTLYSTLACVQRSSPVTIGRPIANARAYVVDPRNQPVPVGVTGELVLAGAGVAGRYLNRPRLTTEAFVEDPFMPGRAYRTGDRARWLPGGELELTAS